MNGMVEFTDPVYLKSGNELQDRVYGLLSRLRVMELLSEYDPVVVGTIPIGIDIPGSDVDILCRARPHGSGTGSFYGLEHLLVGYFGGCQGFKSARGEQSGKAVLTCSFFAEGIEIEVFAQDVPVTGQNGYRHMITEHELLRREGQWLKDRVVELKMAGIKTEPAFAAALGLTGDPYEAILELGRKMGLYH